MQQFKMKCCCPPGFGKQLIGKMVSLPRISACFPDDSDCPIDDISRDKKCANYSSALGMCKPYTLKPIVNKGMLMFSSYVAKN
ncbi:hypothetical protein A9798_00715 [Edwardsiella hoshinae]|uniref:Uncharacterized protein n=1 Tax=Edwardsiella hoshinae TaxID=93378 RepID=A0ABN4SVV0_9GAMM|nr:hypothetical protein A9798_00715 [Edwardsiella hoshinae]